MQLTVPRLRRRLSQLAQLSALACVILGAGVVLAWHLGVFQSAAANAPPHYTGALGLIVGGVALFALGRGHQRWGYMLAIIPAVIAIAGLVAHGSQPPPDFPSLPFGPQDRPPMSIVSALGLLLIAIALAANRAPLLMGAVAAAIMGLGLANVLALNLAELVELTPAVPWFGARLAAAQTAVELLLLGTGLYAHAAATGWHIPRQTGRWLLLPVALISTVLSVSLWQILLTQQQDQLQHSLNREADVVVSEFQAVLRPHVLTLVRMADRWRQQNGTPEQEWVADAELAILHHHAFEGIAFVGPDYRVRWRRPIQNSEQVIGFDMSREPRRREAFDRALETRRAAFTRTHALVTGELGFMVIVPAQVHGGVNGFIAGAFVMEQVFQEVAAGLIRSGDRPIGAFEIVEDGETVFIAGDPVRSREAMAVQRTLRLSETPWQLRVWPTQALLDRYRSPLPLLVLLTGLLMSALLVLVSHLALVASARARALDGTNAALRREVEERQRAEQALMLARDELEDRVAARTAELQRSNRELEEFAYVASHDLKEPLRVIASYGQLLERLYADRLDQRGRAFVDYIVDGAQRMHRLLDDVLTYSRAGRTDAPLEPVDTEQLLERTLRDLSAQLADIPGSRVTHDPLPTVMAHELPLQQVFQNLIANGLKFRGEQPPHVHVCACQEDGDWIFRVEDNGIGIEPGQLDRVFKIFQRLPGADKYPGTGIGLSVVKKIVERYGGTIRAESTVGKGTTFIFSLPVSPPQGDEKQEYAA